MADRYIVPRRLDDPELIGFWTLDEFAGMLIPFAWGILTQHIIIGTGLSVIAWFGLRKARITLNRKGHVGKRKVPYLFQRVRPR